MPEPIETPEPSDAPEDTSDARTSSESEPAEESAFRAITSQEEFDAAIKQRIARAEKSAEKKAQTKLQELETKLQEHENAKLSEEEKRNKRLTELEKAIQEREEKITELERSKLVSDIASELKLPKKLWGRVVGNTEDEVRADIEDIMSDLPKPTESKKPPSQTVKVAPSGDSGEPADDADAILDSLSPRYRG